MRGAGLLRNFRALSLRSPLRVSNRILIRSSIIRPSIGAWRTLSQQIGTDRFKDANDVDEQKEHGDETESVPSPSTRVVQDANFEDPEKVNNGRRYEHEEKEQYDDHQDDANNGFAEEATGIAKYWKWIRWALICLGVVGTFQALSYYLNAERMTRFYLGMVVKDESVSSFWLSALANAVAFTNNLGEEVAKQGGVRLVLNVCKQHEEGGEATLSGAMLLFALMSNPGVRQYTYHTDPDFLDELMQRVTDPRNSVEATQGLLASLKMACYHDGIRRLFLEKGAAKFLIRIIQATDPSVSSAATELLAILISDFPDPKTLKLSPAEKNHFFMAVGNLAFVFSENNQTKQAIQGWQLALSIDPNNPDMLTMLGADFAKMGEAEKAAECFRKSLQLVPGQIEAAYHLAKYLVKTAERDDFRQLSEAVQLLRGGLMDIKAGGSGSREPNAVPGQLAGSPHPITSIVYKLLVSTLEKLGRDDEALEYATEWSLRCISDASASFTVGRLLCQQNDYEEALSALQTSLRMDPSRPETLYQIAVCQIKLNQYPQGKESLQKCIETCESSSITKNKLISKCQVSALVMLAKLAYESKEFDKAADLYQRASHLKPNDPILYAQRGRALYALGPQAHTQSYKAYAQAVDVWNHILRKSNNNQALINYLDTHASDRLAFKSIGKICQAPDNVSEGAEQFEALRSKYHQLENALSI